MFILFLELEEPELQVLTSADTTHAAVLSSIDGNVQLEPSVNTSQQVVRPGGIKINISKPFASTQAKEIDSHIDTNSPLIGTCITPIVSAQPPPPGEEPLPISIKPAMQNVNFQQLPTVVKGSELSGLCSIM